MLEVTRLYPTNLPKKLWTVLAFSAILGSSFNFTGLFSETVASCQQHNFNYTVYIYVIEFMSLAK